MGFFLVGLAALTTQSISPRVDSLLCTARPVLVSLQPGPVVLYLAGPGYHTLSQVQGYAHKNPFFPILVLLNQLLEPEFSLFTQLEPAASFRL